MHLNTYADTGAFRLVSMYGDDNRKNMMVKTMVMIMTLGMKMFLRQ